MGNPLDVFVGRLRATAAAQALGNLSDGELLDRFVGSCDGAAFTALIERHGPMVLGVCRRLLPSIHDAEDACQGAFLVLARKAASLRKKASLGSWLHGVASRVAASLKRDAARRKAREAVAGQAAPRDPLEEVSWREVRAALDEELARLAERYRSPLILCYLECLTRDEAARRLGIPPGTLHGLLERGRDLLRRRLTRRGLTLSAALTASALGEGMAHALPPTLVVCSAKAAALIASGQPLTEVVGANIVALTREVLTSMYLTKLKLAAVLCTALLAVAGGSLASLGFAQDATPKPQAAPKKAESDEDFIRRMSKDLRDADPTPAEVHFFASGKEPRKRQKLIDLFIQERQAKKAAEDARTERLAVEAMKALMAARAEADANARRLALLNDYARAREVAKVQRLFIDEKAARPARLEALQKQFYKELHSAKTKEDIAKVTQLHLDRLMQFVKTDPKGQDPAEAIRQIALLYESQGKDVEAEAWRAKLPKDAPKAPFLEGEKAKSSNGGVSPRGR
jgi:RNA polymerase sigma factor (sigma-70 family)